MPRPPLLFVGPAWCWCCPRRGRKIARISSTRPEHNWTILQLCISVQQRFPTKRPGVGGRPRQKPPRCGPEVALRELQRVNRHLLDFHQHTWWKGNRSGWRKLVQEWPAADDEKLQRLLKNAKDSISKVARACK